MALPGWTAHLEESLTGFYEGEYCRTNGAFVCLLLETCDYARAKKSIKYIFECRRKHKLTRIPHAFGAEREDGKGWIGNDNQVDGRAHVVMSYAKYCLTVDDQQFVNEYYGDAKNEVITFFDQPFLYYHPGNPHWSTTGLGLVFNCSLEHSREGRRWSVFDLLTQSFVGVAGEDMLKLAEKRRDTELQEYLVERLGVLRGSISKHMTRTVDGKKVYLEMRIPDSNWGKEYHGMGWICMSPVAAQWEALEREVLVNTVNLMRKKLLIADPKHNDIRVSAMEFDEDGNIFHSIMGKWLGWDLDYCRQQAEWDRILDWCMFLKYHHSDADILFENVTLKGDEWVKNDCGNGEQCAWWCWAMARLCKEFEIPTSWSPEPGWN